ncbi:BZ3500_MvSof-1268-A1-R1_Chr2-2g04889 [Microbotryum saponariae]|uniref:BZ3500_MvSof-1268-A1-R1_Chr2-2g04889 protein n=1 Tax=Microbotryum saponariae TaxID=289078 RepID=A0A2X0LMY8_9BASI|nr:BZ3500_MvSof-1268-A1-R1_Chr2-2g04889 [Microbotryum saponariae]SDA00413.1 BZ3501_MvSof-1269-A2-R1_Chr2-2g04563 [Microbotryum saponariae]
MKLPRGLHKCQLTSMIVEFLMQHNTEKDLWTVINGDVYDLTKFIDMHPGGTNVLLATAIAGGDSSEAFFSMHRSEVLTKYQRLKIGRVSDPKSRPYLLPIAGELSPVPMAEPGWLVKDFRTPYYDDSHRRLQREMRKFFDTEVKPEARVNEGAAERPSQRVMELMGSPEWEINAMRMGPGPHLQGRKLPGGIKPEEFTYFHELVVIQELVRVGAPGYMAGLNAGMVIGLPPVLNFGSEKMRKEVLPDILRGKTIISLAISEAAAGSDVQGMTTKGTKTADGKYWEVTGNKKWITCGHYSDYFMTGVRTGPGQLSMMLIPRKCETRGDGVDTRIIKTSYSSAAGTAWVTFDKVLVPVENVLGGEGNGLKVILSNFNHERWVICCRIARYSRVIYEETFKWAHLRKVFGKPLIEQPVVRAKFALMLAKIEAGQTWLENLTFQMCNMKYEQQSKMLAGPMALLKYFLSRSQGEIVDEAVQIWGGRGITASGMGVYIEQAQRTYKFDSILGGSEEVLAQLGVRQASKQMPRAVL